jgi:hypothetical protein
MCDYLSVASTKLQTSLCGMIQEDGKLGSFRHPKPNEIAKIPPPCCVDGLRTYTSPLKG